MATIRQNLITRAKNIAIELAAIDITAIGGMPNTKDTDGGTAIDHVGYKKALWDELLGLMKMLGVKTVEELDALDGAEDNSVFEIETQLQV